MGWQDKNGSFDTFLDSAPFFEHPSDFRIEPLVSVGEENASHDLTMIVLQRQARSLDLSLPLVQTVRRLLTQVYDHVSQWKAAFSEGKRDYLYQATDFNSTATLSDNVLDTLMNMAIQIGGKSADHPEQDRWRFCCLLLPQDSTLPVQKRALVVRSQSEHSPYKVNISSVYIDNPGLSLRAYQSGNIIYRPDMSTKDSIIAYQEQEQTNRSAIAIPIIGADGLSIAALYIASDQDHAFPIEDQRVLRIIGTMIEELLLTYQARQQVVGKRTDLIDYPGIVDPSFKPFLTENDFISDLEALLADIHAKNKSECTEKVEVSFIAIDIDHQSTLATKYGNRVARNLSREVGVRLRGLLNLFTNPKHQRLYHINTDRYYLILDEMSLDEARKKAEQLRVALTGDYLIDTQQSFSERSILPENMLTLPDITVRLGVPAYTLYKLKDILGRFDHETAVFEVRDVITRAIDEVLKQGRRDGGNAIISWDHDKWGYAKWTPPN
ncbi:MAG: GAF domain-containing protein [Ktedonobacteraceae bacterium]